MDYCRKSDFMLYRDEILSELHSAGTLVKATKTCCEQREFNREYYGIPFDYVPMISNERNEYISLLTILSDKLKYIGKLDLNNIK